MSRSSKVKIRKPNDEQKPDRGADIAQAAPNAQSGDGRRAKNDPPTNLMFAMFGNEPSDKAMASLMMTAKITHRYCELKISQNKKFSKLSGPRMGVLFFVHEYGGIRMGDLATKLHVAPRTVTDLIDGLERDGFLHRVPDSKDRRASVIELSAMAKKDFNLITEMRSALAQEIFSPLTDAEKETIVLLMGKLRDGPINRILSEDVDRSG